MQCNLQLLQVYVFGQYHNEEIQIDEESEDQNPDNDVGEEVHVNNNGEQFVKGKGFLEVGTRSLAALTTFRFNTRLIVMMWQPERNLNNFLITRTDFRFGMEVL